MNEILADKRLGRAAIYATILAVIALSLFLAARSLPARGAGQPADTLPSESANYRITAEVLAEGGGRGDSANYQLFDTIGEAVESGLSSSANFQLSSGSIPALFPEGPPAHTNEITYPPDGMVTVAPSITVTGQTAADASVVVSVGEDVYPTTAGSGGEYGVADVALTLGPNTITSESTDTYGNRATASVGVTRTTYLLSGTLASRVHDAGQTVGWETISWQADIHPGTSIVFRTRTGNSPDPDETWSAWSEAYTTSGQPISSPAGQYLQYEAAFSTTDGMVSPVLEQVTVNYGSTPPTLTGLPDQLFTHTTSPPSAIDLWDHVSDPDHSASEMTYTVEGTPPTGAGVALTGNRYVIVDPSPNWCGGVDVTIRATDPSGLWDEDTFRVAVSWSCPGPVEMPGAPVLMAPVQGSTARSDTPNFAWHEVGGAETYQIQVDDDADFSSPEMEETTINTEHVPPTRLGTGTYYWRVRASNSSEIGTWSTGWAFTAPTPSRLTFKIYLPMLQRNYPSVR